MRETDLDPALVQPRRWRHPRAGAQGRVWRRDANTTPWCGGVTVAGHACGQPKGWGTPHVGRGRCRYHEAQPPTLVGTSLPPTKGGAVWTILRCVLGAVCGLLLGAAVYYCWFSFLPVPLTKDVSPRPSGAQPLSTTLEADAPAPMPGTSGMTFYNNTFYHNTRDSVDTAIALPSPHERTDVSAGEKSVRWKVLGQVQILHSPTMIMLTNPTADQYECTAPDHVWWRLGQYDTIRVAGAHAMPTSCVPTQR